MKKSIKKLASKEVKNVSTVKGGEGGFGNGYKIDTTQTQQAELL